MQALHDAAARLPRVAIQKPARVIGKDTVEAMQSGVFWGYVALIEGLVARIKAEYAEPLTVIGTGGVASLFQGRHRGHRPLRLTTLPSGACSKSCAAIPISRAHDKIKQTTNSSSCRWAARTRSA